MHRNRKHKRTISMKKEHSFPLAPLSVPEGLELRIFARIGREARKAAVRAYIFIGAGIAACLGSLLFLGQALVSQASASSAMQYLSVLFSDTGVALASWKEISLSIIESVPAETIGLFLLALFAALFLLQSLAKMSGKRAPAFRAA